MTDIPPSHPRHASLKARELLVEGVREGLTAEAGLIAHGRGEAFDYLLGERTTPEAEAAARAAAAHLLLARRPVVSVNGNVAALAAEQVVDLAERVGRVRSSRGSPDPRLVVEVNLFHRTEERVNRVVERLESAGAEGVLGAEPDAKVPGLDHARALCSTAGVGSADVVLIPLEDGDRAEALRAWGRTVIAIDLNPLARTSRAAHVAIIDELTRTLPKVAEAAEGLGQEDEGVLVSIARPYDNEGTLKAVLSRMCQRLQELDLGPPEGPDGGPPGDSI